MSKRHLASRRRHYSPRVQDLRTRPDGRIVDEAAMRAYLAGLDHAPASRPGRPDFAADGLGASGSGRDADAQPEAPDLRAVVSSGVGVGALSPQGIGVDAVSHLDPDLRAGREGALSLASRPAPSFGPALSRRPGTPAPAVTGG